MSVLISSTLSDQQVGSDTVHIYHLIDINVHDIYAYLSYRIWGNHNLQFSFFLAPSLTSGRISAYQFCNECVATVPVFFPY